MKNVLFQALEFRVILNETMNKFIDQKFRFVLENVHSAQRYDTIRDSKQDISPWQRCRVCIRIQTSLPPIPCGI